MSGIVRAALSGTLMLSATTFELASMNAPALAQTLNDLKCTGNPDIPWDEQIVGCTKSEIAPWPSQGKISDSGRQIARPESHRRAASLVVKILRGQKPGDFREST